MGALLVLIAGHAHRAGYFAANHNEYAAGRTNNAGQRGNAVGEHACWTMEGGRSARLGYGNSDAGDLGVVYALKMHHCAVGIDHRHSAAPLILDALGCAAGSDFLGRITADVRTLRYAKRISSFSCESPEG